MDDFLVPVKTTRSNVNDTQPEPIPKDTDFKLDSASDVIQVLKHEPDFASVERVVRFLSKEGPQVDIRIPSPTATQILHLLVSDVLPNYWEQIFQDDSMKKLSNATLRCLRSIPALGAIVARLRMFATESGAKDRQPGKSFLVSRTARLISLLEKILATDNCLLEISTHIQECGTSGTQRRLLWKELVTIAASGKLVSAVSEAEDSVKLIGDYQGRSWIGNGQDYCAWLGHNIGEFVSCMPKERMDSACSQLISKSFSLGYTDAILSNLFTTIGRSKESGVSSLVQVLRELRVFETRSFATGILRILNTQLTVNIEKLKLDESLDVKKVSKAAAFLRLLSTEIDSVAEILLDTLTKPESATILLSPLLLRAVFASLLSDEERLDWVLERSFAKFSDELFIKHGTILQQEMNAQLVLLAVGHFHRNGTESLKAESLKAAVKSSEYLNGVSKHLSSSSTRIRWLGMVVATTVSGLADKSGTKMAFDDESMSTPEAEWYRSLALVDDEPSGSWNLLDLFGQDVQQPRETKSAPSLPIRQKGRHGRSKKAVAKPEKSNVIEVIDDDIVAYAKPDSDPEDEDDDPTLINRDKPRPPVYIRDLLVGLRETEDYDRHHIALSKAASLIRQKSGFGKEVIDHAEELASVLVNLNDQFEFDDFVTMRQEALIAVLLAQPGPMAQFLARAVFEGDFSLQQRTDILTALGLGARELGGFKDNDRTPVPSFPSKQLPEHLHKIYSDAPTALARVSSRLEQTMVEPMALKAADELTGPNALKVRTFSSRMAVQKSKPKPTPNALAAVVADGFFFPLTGRWWIKHASGSSPFHSEHLLPVYLRTLAVMLHAAGPWALALPQMTSEFWDVLLAVRSGALANKRYGVLEALLFALLVLLEVNENKERLAAEHAKEILETQEWSRLVLERIAPGDAEGDRARMLAASIIVRCGEVAHKWQKLMIGDMVDF